MEEIINFTAIFEDNKKTEDPKPRLEFVVKPKKSSSSLNREEDKKIEIVSPRMDDISREGKKQQDKLELVKEENS